MKVRFFATCLAEAFYPKVARDCVEVLNRLGFTVEVPQGQTCCGLPLYNNGFHDEARGVAEQTVKAMAGDGVVATPSGSCAWMMRKIYPELLGTEAARAFAGRVKEFSEVCASAPPKTFALPKPQTLTYHPSCHLLRGLHVDGPPRALLAACAGAAVAPLPKETECCGFGGTFSVRYAEVSGAMLEDKLGNAAATAAQTLVVTDVGCLMHLRTGAQKQGCPFEVKHLAEVLAEGEVKSR
jgi:L-lactate dehydrogenase complex protein LldE